MEFKGVEQKRQSNLLSRKEVAEYLGVTVHTLAVWKCTGRYNLPCVKIGGLAKYRKEDLDDFILSRTTGLVRKEVTA